MQTVSIFLNHMKVKRCRESLCVKFDPLYAKEESPSNTESVADPIEYDIVPDNHTDCILPKHVTLMSNKDKPTHVVSPVVNVLPQLATNARSTPRLIRSRCIDLSKLYTKFWYW